MKYTVRSSRIAKDSTEYDRIQAKYVSMIYFDVDSKRGICHCKGKFYYHPKLFYHCSHFIQ